MTRKTWQRRQAELKKAAIVELLNASISGESQEAAARRIASAYNGRRLPEGKRLRLSAEHLKRLWREWKKNPDDSVFDLNYAGPEVQSVITPWIAFLIVDIAVVRGLTIPQAYARIKQACPDLPFHERTLRRHISDADKKRIAKAVKLHRQADAVYKEKKKLTGGN